MYENEQKWERKLQWRLLYWFWELETIVGHNYFSIVHFEQTNPTEKERLMIFFANTDLKKCFCFQHKSKNRPREKLQKIFWQKMPNEQGKQFNFGKLKALSEQALLKALSVPQNWRKNSSQIDQDWSWSKNRAVPEKIF